MSIIDDLDCEALISRLAGPLSPPDRVAFRRAAEEALARVPCWGEGAIYRAVAALQRQFFSPPSFGRTGWGTERQPRPSKLKSATPIAHAGDGRRIVQYRRRERSAPPRRLRIFTGRTCSGETAMPAYVIVSSKHRSGNGVDAVICDLNGAGGPDHKSAVPVRIEFVNERVLAVDGRSHEIVSTCGAGDGTATYLINFSTQRLRNRARRLALAQASAHLQRLRAHLLPISAQSEHPQLATKGLKLLATWFAEEAERLSGR